MAIFPARLPMCGSQASLVVPTPSLYSSTGAVTFGWQAEKAASTAGYVPAMIGGELITRFEAWHSNPVATAFTLGPSHTRLPLLVIDVRRWPLVIASQCRPC